MRLRFSGPPIRAVLFATAFAFTLPFSTEALSQPFQQVNLVTDDAAFLASQGFTPAATVDPHLINPWGMSYGATSPFWISNQGSNTSTLYTGNGTAFPQPTPLVVTIPGSAGPTGQAFTGGSGFNLEAGGTAAFVFATLDGTIAGWTGSSGTTASIEATTPGAVYTGIAMGSSGGSNFLFAANNANGSVDVFDHNFDPVNLGAGAFTDQALTDAGLSPFNVVNVGGQLFVTYAAGGADADEQALGIGAVDVFGTDGTLIGRFATGSGLTGGLVDSLVSPWGVAQAPAGFGSFGGDILIGNFSDEDGFINIFDTDGNFLGMLTMGADSFNMPYLWALGFRTGGPNVDTNALYFTAGIGDEEHGLFAALVGVPEPSTWAMMLIGFGAIGLSFRRSAKLKRSRATT